MSRVSVLYCGICLSDVGEDPLCVCVCACMYALVCVAFVVEAASIGFQKSNIGLRACGDLSLATCLLRAFISHSFVTGRRLGCLLFPGLP